MIRPAQLGDAEKAQYTQMAAGAAGTAAGVAAAAHWIPAAAAGPIGLAVAGVALALTALFSRRGPQQRLLATDLVEDLEPLMQRNLDGYLDGPRTRASQAAALANFDQAWAFLTSAQACGNPALGNPGRACIQDRQRGGRWDWFAYYRDPIAQDPHVRDDAAAELLPALDTETSRRLTAALPIAALILLGVLL